MEFTINLKKNQYTNFSNMLLSLPIKIEKRSNTANNTDGDLITVNNLFMHWIREINVKTYGDDIAALPLNNVLEIHRYSDSMLKHLPKDSIKTFEKELLYSKTPVIVKNSTNDRREISYTTEADRSDENIAERIAKFYDLLGTNNVYRIPLTFLVNLGFVNFPSKFDTKFTFDLKQNLSKLFESTKRVTNITTTSPDARKYFLQNSIHTI